MTFKARLAADAAAFLNLDENADPVYYNGATAPIAAVVEIGEDAGRGNTFSGQGSAARAVIWVSAVDVPAPTSRDTYSHNSRIWRHARILESDGIIHKLECTSSEGVFG